jgi:hypothetical protein
LHLYTLPALFEFAASLSLILIAITTLETLYVSIGYSLGFRILQSDNARFAISTIDWIQNGDLISCINTIKKVILKTIKNNYIFKNLIKINMRLSFCGKACHG